METYLIRRQVSALDDFSSRHLPVFECNSFFFYRQWMWCFTFKDSTEIQYGLKGSCSVQNDPQSVILGGPWLTLVFLLYWQGKAQECYANLTLKAPRVQSGRSSPQIQYSDIIQVEDPPEAEREDEGCAEGASILSDLYASVQTQRVKTIDPAGDGEGYANHLWEEVMVKKATCSLVHVPPLGGAVGLWDCGNIRTKRTKRSKWGLCWPRVGSLDCWSLKVCPVLLSPFWQSVAFTCKVFLYPETKYYNFTVSCFFCIIKMLEILTPIINAFI